MNAGLSASSGLLEFRQLKASILMTKSERLVHITSFTFYVAISYRIELW